MKYYIKEYPFFWYAPEYDPSDFFCEDENSMEETDLFITNLPKADEEDIYNFRQSHCLIEESYITYSFPVIDRRNLADIARKYGANNDCPLHIHLRLTIPKDKTQIFTQQYTDTLISNLNSTEGIVVKMWGVAPYYGEYREELSIGFSKELWLKNLRLGRTEIFSAVARYDTYTQEEQNEIADLFYDALEHNKTLYSGEDREEKELQNFIITAYSASKGENLLAKRLQTITVQFVKENHPEALSLFFLTPFFSEQETPYLSKQDIELLDCTPDDKLQALVACAIGDSAWTKTDYLILSTIFREGIVIEQDQHMADILRRAYDFEIVSDDYVWLSNNEEDNQYVLDWLSSTANSNKPYRMWAKIKLAECYEDGYGVPRNPILAFQMYVEAVSMYKHHKPQQILSKLDCLFNLTEVEGLTEDTPIEEYAELYKPYFFYGVGSLRNIAHLYEYGFCKEDIDGVDEADMDIFQRTYKFAQTLKQYKTPTDYYNYINNSIAEGNLIASLFVDKAEYLLDGRGESSPEILNLIMEKIDEFEEGYVLRMFTNNLVYLCKKHYSYRDYNDCYDIAKILLYLHFHHRSDAGELLQEICDNI